MLHHGGMREEEVSERVFVASLMQRVMVLKQKRCCITVACGRNRMASDRMASEYLLHHGGMREDGFYVGEMLHHGGLQKE